VRTGCPEAKHDIATPKSVASIMGEEVAATGVRRFSTGPRLVWALIGLLVLIVIFIVAWTYLQWSIAEQVYLLKSGLDWFGITFYHVRRRGALRTPGDQPQARSQ
jgi:hypothetical protein